VIAYGCVAHADMQLDKVRAVVCTHVQDRAIRLRQGWGWESGRAVMLMLRRQCAVADSLGIPTRRMLMRR